MISLDGRWQRIQGFHDRTYRVGGHPGVERRELGFKHIAEERARLAAPLVAGIRWRNWRPADLHRVLHHRELDGAGFTDFKGAHAATSWLCAEAEDRADRCRSDTETSPVISLSSSDLKSSCSTECFFWCRSILRSSVSSMVTMSCASSGLLGHATLKVSTSFKFNVIVPCADGTI